MLDLTGSLEASGQPVQVSAFKERNGGSPVRQYIQSLGDGDVLLVEQNHCEMENLTVSLWTANAKPGALKIAQLARGLEASAIWQRAFGDVRAEDALKTALEWQEVRKRLEARAPFTYGIDEALSSKTESSFASIAFAPVEGNGGAIERVVSIYIGIGGQ